MEELDHRGEFVWKWAACEVWSCGGGGEGVEIPILKSFSWTLALRYLNPLRTFVSVITLISLLGVSFGVMVLIVVLSVHNGFERNLKDTLLGHSPHISVYSNDGSGVIENWEQEEVSLAEESGVESAYALVEGFVLLDTPRWQRPAIFRAFNTENQGQIDALEKMLDPDYPGSSVDFNPPLDESSGAAPPPPPALDDSLGAPPAPPLDGEVTELPELKPIDDSGEIFGERYAVISSQLADTIGLGPGDDIRVMAASNFDEVMAVYNVPKLRAWDLYTDDFERFESEVTRLFQAQGDEEASATDELLQAYRVMEDLVPRPIETADGTVMTTGREMRSVEKDLIYGILNVVEMPMRRDESFDYHASGSKEAILAKLAELRELDLEKADNQAFRNIKKFVVPKTLRIQGVYADSERSKGPDLFIPINIGMELKGLRGSVESIGLRIDEPYDAEEHAVALQAKLGEAWIVQSWMRTHADRFQLVKTEKIMMSFALSFITLLSAFSIMAVMYTVTVQKRQEIGVMKALGARPSQIVRVFVYQGLIVGVGGAVLGLGMGLLAIRYREGVMAVIRGFGVDPFPAEFHGMSELPAETVWSQLAVIGVVAVVLCLLAALVPALMAAFRDPAKSLRNL